MGVPSLLGYVGDFVAGLLDIVAWPATQVVALFRANNEPSFLGEMMVAALMNVLLWAFVSLMFHTALLKLSIFLEIDLLRVLCRSGDLKSVRATVRATHRLCLILDRCSAFFGHSDPGSRYSRDDFDSFSVRRHSPVQPMMRTLIRISVIARACVAFLGKVLLSWGGILFIVIVFWVCMRPVASFWAPGADIISSLIKVLGEAAVVGWIPIVLLLLAVASTARIRGAYAWRTEKFKNAYSVLDEISHKTASVLFSIHEAIEDCARFFSHHVIQDAVSSLTNDRGFWTEGSIEYLTMPRQKDPGRSVFRKDSFRKGRDKLENGVQTIELAQALRERYRKECSERSLTQEVHNIAPRETRLLLWHLSPRSTSVPLGSSQNDNVPYLGSWANLRMLTTAGVEEYVGRWNDQCDEIASQFRALDPETEPSEQLIADALEEVQDLIDELRECIVRACWLEEDLRQLMNTGWKARYPDGLTNLWQSIKGR